MVLLPVLISVSADTADLLIEMAYDLNSSLDDLVSVLAEDAVVGLSPSKDFLDDVVIPDSFTREDLMNALE